MAHVGRLYPVHFRRDLSLQVGRKDFYWPRYFVASLAWTEGPIGAKMRFVDWGLIAPHFDNDTGRVTVTSPVKSVNGRLVYWEVASDVVGKPQHYDLVFSAYGVGAELLYAEKFPRPVIDAYSLFETRDVANVIYETDVYFRGPVLGINIDRIRAATWAEI